MTETDDNDILILLAEDYDSDAVLITMELSEQIENQCQIKRTSDLRETLDWLQTNTPDAVFLDMNLGDSTGLDTVKAVFEAAGDAPIIVVTGNATTDAASSVLEVGAQDFLTKQEINGRNLRNIVSFAVARRQAELRRIEHALDSYRDVADRQREPAETTVAPLSETNPELYDHAVTIYRGLINAYLDNLAHTIRAPMPELRTLVVELGEAGAGPRDIIDIHVRVLGEEMQSAKPARAKHLNTDGRLLALEILGRLASFYRQRALSTSNGR